MRPEGISKKQWFKYNLYLVIEHFIGRNRSEKYIRPYRNRLAQDILASGQLEGRGKVYRNEDILCEDVEGLLKDKRKLMEGPLLFKGAAKDWPCVSKWNKNYFREHFYHHQISLVGNVGLVEKERENVSTSTNLKDYIDELSKDKKNYLRFARFIDEDPELRKDMDVSWMEKFKSKVARGGYLYLFMGEEGSKTDMHNAIIQSLFVQVKGRKKWTIYPSNERIFLDVKSDRRPYFFTDANPNREDDPNFPLIKYANRYEVILEEGDVLWFPTFYWHYVENLSENIGVTYKYTEFNRAIQESKILSLLFFLSTKPTIIESLYYNIVKKRDLLFEKHH